MKHEEVFRLADKSGCRLTSHWMPPKEAPCWETLRKGVNVGEGEQREGDGGWYLVDSSWKGGLQMLDKRCLILPKQLEPDQLQLVFQRSGEPTRWEAQHLSFWPTQQVPGGLNHVYFQDSSPYPPTPILLHLLADAWNSFHNWKMGVLKCKQVVKILGHMLK